MMNPQADATYRIEQYLKQNNFERAADVIADVLHWCNSNDVLFEAEVDTAAQYVTEEQNIFDC